MSALPSVSVEMKNPVREHRVQTKESSKSMSKANGTRFDVTLLPLNMRSKTLPSEEQSFNGTQCWDWLGAKNSRGYGSMTNGRGGSMLTHRKAYEVIVGPIPARLTIDHLCFNKLCVNTDHMEPVTGAENTRRAALRITHCAQGHLLSGDNMRVKRRKNGRVQRVCKTCQNKWMRAWRAKSKVEPVVRSG